MSYLHPPLSEQLARSLRSLQLFEPFRSSVARPQWQSSMEDAEGVLAVLEMIDAYEPGLLSQLALEALEDAEIRRKPMPEVTALVERYARSEKLR